MASTAEKRRTTCIALKRGPQTLPFITAWAASDNRHGMQPRGFSNKTLGKKTCQTQTRSFSNVHEEENVPTFEEQHLSICPQSLWRQRQRQTVRRLTCTIWMLRWFWTLKLYSTDHMTHIVARGSLASSGGQTQRALLKMRLSRIHLERSSAT